MLGDALSAFLGFRLPNVLVSLVLRRVPFMRNAFTHEDDENFAAIGVLVGSVQFVPAEDVVAGTQILAGHAHAPLENDDGMPALVGVRGLDITGRKLDLNGAPSLGVVSAKNLDLRAFRKLQTAFCPLLPRNLIVV